MKSFYDAITVDLLEIIAQFTGAGRLLQFESYVLQEHYNFNQLSKYHKVKSNNMSLTK